MNDIEKEADDYARMEVTPLYRGGETPTPYERGQLAAVRRHFIAGALAAMRAAVPSTEKEK